MDKKRTKARVFQERTNSSAPALLSVSTPTKSVMDPPTMTPHFGPPSIYVIEVADHDNKPTTDSQPRPEVDETRRLKRYLIAEQELAETFQRSQRENTSYELQIEALRKATSVLNSQVADAGERVVKLRNLLADRATEPSIYRSLQRERWMEERRQLATEHLSKVLQQHLSTLSSQPEASPKVNPPNPALNLKADTNLVRFFESSSRQRVTRHRVRRRVPMASRPRLDKTVDIPSIHDHKQVIPLLLSVPKQRPAFLQEMVPLKPHPLPVIAIPTSPQLSAMPPASASTHRSHLDPISEILEFKSPGQPSTPAVDTSPANGTAIIWRDALRSTEEILAELVVEMPDYVVDLLAGFNSTSSASTSVPALHNFQSPPATSSRTTFIPETPRPAKASPLPLHQSPSRKRISALFSLPEALSSRRVINTDAAQQKRLSALPTQTIPEQPARPFSVSFSALPSSDSGGSHEADEDDKVLSRFRRRMSALRRL